MIEDYKGNIIKESYSKQTTYDRFFGDDNAKVIEEKFYSICGTLIKTIKYGTESITEYQLTIF